MATLGSFTVLILLSTSVKETIDGWSLESCQRADYSECQKEVGS
jgi:hypothetical protein